MLTRKRLDARSDGASFQPPEKGPVRTADGTRNGRSGPWVSRRLRPKKGASDFAPKVASYIKIIREMDKPEPCEFRLVQLRHASPGDVIRCIRSAAGQEYKSTEFLPDYKNARVLVIAAPNMLKRCVKIIEELDTKAGERVPVLTCFRLEHARAESVAKTINASFSKEEKSRGFTAEPEAESNCLLVKADKTALEQLRAVIETMDAASSKK